MRVAGTKVERGARAVVAIVALAVASPASAQCVGDLGSELVGLSRAVDAIVSGLNVTDGEVERSDAETAVRNGSTFAAAVAAAGESTAACLITRFDAFSRAALNALGDADERVPTQAMSDLLTRATASALRDRYTSTGVQYQLFFGLGFSTAIDPEDIEKFKIVKRISATADSSANATLQDSSFVVRESDSTGLPTAMTGLLVRFTARRILYGLVPTAAFASAQLSGGDIGIVNGAVLGLGWRLAGDTHLLLGYSLARTRSLRQDLRSEFDALENGRLALAPGETEESILGTETANFWSISLAVPLSLGSSLGGG